MRTLAVIIAALPLIACNGAVSSDKDEPGIAGTATGNARTYQVADFTEVALRGSDDVEVLVGGAFSVRAEGDPEVLEYLKIEKDGGTLKIGRRDRRGFNWGDRSAKVYVTMPRIAGGTVAGSGDMTVDRAEGTSFNANSAGSGSIKIAALATDTANFNVAGSGNIDAAGTAKSIKANIAGSGSIDGSALKASDANISIAGSGDVKLDVNGNAKVSILGSGDVDLGPSATCNVSQMGSGNVTCGR